MTDRKFNTVLIGVLRAKQFGEGLRLSLAEVELLSDGLLQMARDVKGLEADRDDARAKYSTIVEMLKAERKRNTELDAFIKSHPNSEFALSEIAKLGLSEE